MRFRATLLALGLAGALGFAMTPAAQANGLRLNSGDVSIGIYLYKDLDRHGWRKHRSHAYRLSPRRVRRILRFNGFHDISRPDYRPRYGVYVAFAEHRHKRDVRVIVDAYSGRILDVDRIHRHGPRPR